MAARQQPLTSSDREIGAELAEWGKVALIETTGRVTGKPITAAVGFVGDGEGGVYVAAGSESSDWVRNLSADALCRVTIGDRTAHYVATRLPDGDERSRVLAELILKYGTPAERLGHGPVFRLVATSDSDQRSRATS